MDVLLMIGDHPRHAYIAEQVAQTGYLSGIVVEDRGAHIPEPPENLNDELAELYRHHFERRAKAETSFFGDCDIPAESPQKRIDRSELNTEVVHDFIKNVDPDLTLTYGVHKLSEGTLKKIGSPQWNIHGGLSPQYRGVITHFWPSYMLEPQMTGITLHELTTELDAGPIVHQTAAPLVEEDGIHELACRTVSEFGKELTEVVDVFERGELSEPKTQNSTGKLWLAKDWRPDHLRVIYEKFDNQIVDLYLNGELEQREPELIRQFE